MFTGVIQGTATVTKKSSSSKVDTAQIQIKLARSIFSGIKKGDSLSVNGACLTITKVLKDTVEVQMIDETLNRTNLGLLEKGNRVNVERSLKVGQRMEGHFVLGHIDGTGVIYDIEKHATETKFWIKVPKRLARYVVEKGSVALDGISLTVVDSKKTIFSVCLIPHTLKVTNLSSKKVGDLVNVETDILGKYALK